jgi:hypothetical protein
MANFNVCTPPDMFKVIKLRKVSWTEHYTHTGKVKYKYRTAVG